MQREIDTETMDGIIMVEWMSLWFRKKDYKSLPWAKQKQARLRKEEFLDQEGQSGARK